MSQVQRLPQQLVQGGLRWFFRRWIRHSIRHKLSGIWIQGQWPTTASVIAANHHAWWDGYIAAELAWQHQQEPLLIVQETTLQQFPFFRALGAVGHQHPRVALQRLKAGQNLIIYPEGHLAAPAQLQPLQAGAVWFAQKAQVPLIPLAVRVIMRAQEYPEVYVLIGTACSPAHLAQQLAALLHTLDQQLANQPPEQTLAGFRLLSAGQLSSQSRLAHWSRWLRSKST